MTADEPAISQRLDGLESIVEEITKTLQVQLSDQVALTPMPARIRVMAAAGNLETLVVDVRSCIDDQREELGVTASASGDLSDLDVRTAALVERWHNSLRFLRERLVSG